MSIGPRGGGFCVPQTFRISRLVPYMGVPILVLSKHFPHSIGFSGRQRSLDCQKRLPRYFPCAPSSQLRNLSENKLYNISSLKIYH